VSRWREDGRRPLDAGMSLAEVMVTIGLLAFIGTLLTATAVMTLRSVTVSQVRLDDATQGELAVAAASKVLRTAVLPEQLEDQTCTVLINGSATTCGSSALTEASGTKVRFFANLNNSGSSIGPSLVTLYVAQRSGQRVLVQDTEAPLARNDGSGSYTFCSLTSSTSCSVPSRVIGRALVADLPVFTYYDYDGKTLGSAPLSAEALRKVSSVDVVVTVRSRPGDPKHPSRTALTRVRLPNVEINVVNQA